MKFYIQIVLKLNKHFNIHSQHKNTKQKWTVVHQIYTTVHLKLYIKTRISL